MRTMEGLHAAGLGSARRDPNTQHPGTAPEGADEAQGCDGIEQGNERRAV